MNEKKFNDEELYSDKTSDGDDLYAKELSLDKPPKIPDEPIKISDKPTETEKPRTFHSKHFTETQDEDPGKDKRKRKLSHAETSGVAISAVMLVYSLTTQDKPLFFASAALIIFLLRPLIGALCGEHNQAVQNALHVFSLVLFVGALIMLFL